MTKKLTILGLVILQLLLATSCKTSRPIFDNALYPERLYYIGVGFSKSNKNDDIELAKLDAYNNVLSEIDGLKNVKIISESQTYDNTIQAHNSFSEQYSQYRDIEIDTSIIEYFIEPYSKKDGVVVHAVINKEEFKNFENKRVQEEQKEVFKILANYYSIKQEPRKLLVLEKAINYLSDSLWGSSVEYGNDGKLLNSLRAEWNNIYSNINENDEFLITSNNNLTQDMAFKELLELGYSYITNKYNIYLTEASDKKEIIDFVTELFKINADKLQYFSPLRNENKIIYATVPKTIIDEKLQDTEAVFKTKIERKLDIREKNKRNLKLVLENLVESQKIINSTPLGQYYLMGDTGKTYKEFVEAQYDLYSDCLSFEFLEKEEFFYLGNNYYVTFKVNKKLDLDVENIKVYFTFSNKEGKKVYSTYKTLSNKDSQYLVTIGNKVDIEFKNQILFFTAVVDYGPLQVEVTPSLNSFDFIVPTVKSGNIENGFVFLGSDKLKIDLKLQGQKPNSRYSYDVFIENLLTGKKSKIGNYNTKFDCILRQDYSFTDNDKDGKYLVYVIWSKYPNYRIYQTEFMLSTISKLLNLRKCEF